MTTPKTKRLTFDIETLPADGDTLARLMPAFDKSEVKTGNIKDPAKIAEKIAEAESNYVKDYIERAPLHAERARVGLIGVLEHTALTWLDDADEKTLLENFWARLRETPEHVRICGHNIVGFDIPFLIRRSLLLEVPRPWWIIDEHNRYLSGRFCDTMRLWAAGDYQCRISLDTLARACGLGGKSGSGADFAALWANDRRAALDYCERDLRLTDAILERFGV